MKCDRRVAVGRRIDRHAGGDAAGFMQPVDQRALMVRLAEIDLETERLALRLAHGLDIGERLAAINTRFALAQRI